MITPEIFESASCYEYPDMKALLDTGLEPGAFYEYVTSTYVTMHLPYLTPVRVVLLERYRDNPESKDPEDHPITDAEIEEALGGVNTNFGKFGDDVVFVGETPEYWWVLHLDCDVSDCCIGRMRKSEVSREQLLSWVDSYVGDGDHTWKVRAEILVDRVRGWVSFRG